MSSFKKIQSHNNSLLIKPIYDNDRLELRTKTIGVSIKINGEEIILDKYYSKEIIHYLISLL